VLVRFARAMLLGTTFVAAFATLSSAQTLGVGLSFLERSGTGVTLDYAVIQKALANARALSSVVEVSFHRERFPGGSGSNTLIAEGGVRLRTTSGDSFEWHVQGLVGLVRNSTTRSDEFQEFCDVNGLDCRVSRYALLITPGVGAEYTFRAKMAVRVQLDVPVADLDSPVTRFWFGLAIRLGE
jgi:hypothetical protein